MGILRGVVKGAIVTKAVSVAQRELSKPENQRRIKQALRKVSGR